jgi:hypothetical protein
MMKIDAFDFVIVDIFSQLVKIDDQWRSIVFYFKKMIFAERNYEINDQKMLVIVKICKKWRHYIENVKHSIRVIIDHANFKNFFINKAFNRKKVEWWKRLIELDLRIKYRSEKSNLADDSSRKRDYEDEIAKKDKNNENLNFKKWILIENKNILKSKNEKKKKRTSFRRQTIDMYLCRMQTASRQRHSKQSTKRRETIISRTMIQQIAQNSQSLKTHRISWKKRKSLRLLKEFWKERNFSNHCLEISIRSRINFVSKTSQIAKILHLESE